MTLSKTRQPTTWRQILSRHSRLFLRWLHETRRPERDLGRIADALAGFLVESIDRCYVDWPEAPIEFWKRIPEVRHCCSKVEIFEKPLAAEAYAYAHLLERYRRMWRTLEYLSKAATLPLGIHGVRVLDIGAGPAPASYAVADFYNALSEFAAESEVPELTLPSAKLAYVEQSPSMSRFVHAFSEYSRRQGPFAPVEANFGQLDLPSKRAGHRRQHEAERYWDEDTGQYEEIYDPVTAYEEAERLYRYRFIILSNFLTEESHVQRFETGLRELFEDLRPGGVVVVLGARSGPYRRIYEDLSSLAREAGLTEAGWHSDGLGTMTSEDEAFRIIKEAQHRVYRHIERLVPPGSLPREKKWPDYWRPQPSPRARPGFALRVYRSGRWPAVSKAV